MKRSGKKNPTVRDFAEASGRSKIAEHKALCGTPQSVANQMEARVTAAACDGFVLAATHMPGVYEDVVRLLVAELQRHGLSETGYRGATLRGNLGLPTPFARGWPTGRRAAR